MPFLNIQRKLVITLTIAGATLSIFGLYDYFFDPKGGFFCPTLNNSEFHTSGEDFCLSSGTSFATSFVHSGRENMYLVKFGSEVFKSCYWVDETKYEINISPKEYINSKSKRHISVLYQCSSQVNLTITKR